MLEVKLYIYQLFRSLAYIHSQGICHRDIKPQNLLLDPTSGILKLCDFGSAKILVENEPNVSYICSRYYRAPELIFGATNYTTKIGKRLKYQKFWKDSFADKDIDVWSTGCVMAELMLGSPLFPGESGIDQLVEIIKVLGTPTRDQIRTMNPNYMEHKFPQIKPHPFNKVRNWPGSSQHATNRSTGVPQSRPSCHRLDYKASRIHSDSKTLSNRGHGTPILWWIESAGHHVARFTSSKFSGQTFASLFQFHQAWYVFLLNRPQQYWPSQQNCQSGQTSTSNLFLSMFEPNWKHKGLTSNHHHSHL